MTPEDFNSTREVLGMTRTQFAEALGLAPNTVTAYQFGRKRIPRYVALACSALVHKVPVIGDNESAA